MHGAQSQLNGGRVHTWVWTQTHDCAQMCTRLCIYTCMRVCVCTYVCVFPCARVVAGVCGRDQMGVRSPEAAVGAAQAPQVLRCFRYWESWVRGLGQAALGGAQSDDLQAGRGGALGSWGGSGGGTGKGQGWGLWLEEPMTSEATSRGLNVLVPEPRSGRWSPR